MNDARTAPRRRWLSVLGSMIACLAILAASAAAIVVINRTEPTAQQISATRKSAALVETVTVQRGTYAPRLAVLGGVEPAQEIVLSPRVAGQVIELSPEFLPGGMVRRGDTLLRIDPVDFENTLSIRKTDLQRAEASLEIEEGRQDLARKELDLLGETIDETNRALALREPQLRSMQAQVRAAEAKPRRRRDRPVMFSEAIGFRLWGIDDEPFCPAPNDSRTSPSSLRCRWRISVANRSSEEPVMARALMNSAWRSRWVTCEDAGSIPMRRRSHTYASTAGGVWA